MERGEGVVTIVACSSSSSTKIYVPREGGAGSIIVRQTGHARGSEWKERR